MDTDQSKSERDEDWARLINKVYGTTSGLETSLREFATETRSSLAELSSSVAVTAQKIDYVSDLVKPIPVQVAKLEVYVTKLQEQDRSFELGLEEIRDSFTTLGFKVAGIDNGSGKPAFWDGSIIKYVFILASTLVAGLLALAGYKVK